MATKKPVEKVTQGEDMSTPKEKFVVIKDKFISFLKRTFKTTNTFYIILGITAAILIVLYIWFYDPSVRNERNRLKKENKELQKQRNLIADSLRELESDFIELRSQDSIKTARLAEIDADIEFIKQNVKNSSNNINQIKSRLNTTNTKIVNNEGNPVKRDGDKLINSLKSHLNRKN